jgi:hypothetical protein
MNRGVDAVGAADVKNDVLGAVGRGLRRQDLANDRLGDVRNHVVQRAQRREVRARIGHLVDLVEIGLRSVDVGKVGT